MSSAIENKLKYSIIVPVHNNASDLRKCLAGLDAQTHNHKQFEVIVVNNNSTDDSVAVAKQAGVRCLDEYDFQSAYAARNRGIKAAHGEFIVFLESDCVAHPEWLEHIDAEANDPMVGCLAGEILAVKPTATIERFSEAIEPLRQRGPLSGWHFKPYALMANATYRKVVFEKVGLFDPTMKSGGDAALAWRMLSRTDFRIQFVPQAIVYCHRRTSVPGLWSQFRCYGGAKMKWALDETDYQPPAVSKLEAEVVAAFDQLVAKLEATGASTQEIVFPLLRSMTQVAHYSGYLQELLNLMSHGAPRQFWPRIACEHAIACNICGSRAFVPGPGKRMVGTRAPQCFQCGSLERHRVLHMVLSAMDRTELSQWTCLGVGEPLPGSLKWFSKTSHVDLAELAVKGVSAPYDLVVAMNVLSWLDNNSIEDTLAALVSPLKDGGMLILVDHASDKALGGPVIDFESRIAQHLPNVSVRSSWALDRVTGATKIVTLASPDEPKASQIALYFSKKLLG